MTNEHTAKEALQWITDILKRKGVPFQITGGLAGIAYGSGRPLNDIDIDAPEDKMMEIVPDVKEFIEFGPERYKGEEWDLMILTLNYKGQTIDISGAHETYLFNKDTQKWIHVPCNLEEANNHRIFDMDIPVVAPKDYIYYKRIINRTIDGVAIDQIDADAAEKTL